MNYSLYILFINKITKPQRFTIVVKYQIFTINFFKIRKRKINK